ncbi:arginine deiminase [Tetragenococcus koreensis]|uniref:arginine deiminase n=1 Tax=Tetragenococcus koreensis TaxID=290335 RepID=UPI001F3DE2BB|nr:arginine deiminase [Tetragenococcus koreensis]MCF1584688.1 arginine deiminase [Tetragenococcus koreensis]MCF1614282.1 arginine deiminase [Tetragenococcus koreensis]MCF1616492.1 arginine deiminase [Tetragenococcus koreensis]MCF1621424.1 arginine deiminase [Tetragenococcus koreensis]MCF1624082.1 arginine deiminase [Tetragenococcus koreensis]
MSKPINVFSEIGNLKTVMLHRPGKELGNLMPDYLRRLLFDDIPFLEQAQKEHDYFAEVLRVKGIEVLYLEDLAAESLINKEIRVQFINQYIEEANIRSQMVKEKVGETLAAIKDNRDLIDKTISGIQKTELPGYKMEGLTDMVESGYPFVIDPMPNLYFTRDSFATIGNGVSLNRMYSVTRQRETIYGQYIFDYHPRFAGKEVPKVYDRNETTRIEGGDELVLSKDVLAVGISQRTDAASIEKLAKNIFEQELGFNCILAFNIGEHRKFMHLDTVFTMIDYDKFTIHPEIEGTLEVYSITSKGNGELKIVQEEGTLEHILAKYLNRNSVQLIRCGDGNITAAAREQWNDGSNTLTIAPGEVVVYDRNTVTNKALERAGVKLNYIPGSELVRGRGGPRCMSMPLYRENLTE